MELSNLSLLLVSPIDSLSLFASGDLNAAGCADPRNAGSGVPFPHAEIGGFSILKGDCARSYGIGPT